MSFGRLLRGSVYLTAGLLAALAGVIVGVVLLLVVVMTKGDADPAKARVEVQNYYEARFPGQVEVVDCDYVATAFGFRCRAPVRSSRAATSLQLRSMQARSGLDVARE